jgi:hypothetical protein
MRVRKPNRVTTPRQAVLNGTRTSHASMPRTRGRWRPGLVVRGTMLHAYGAGTSMPRSPEERQ